LAVIPGFTVVPPPVQPRVAWNTLERLPGGVSRFPNGDYVLSLVGYLRGHGQEASGVVLLHIENR
jgi:hypothetical protein